MARYPLMRGAEYYKLAAQKAKEVIDAEWYSFDDYAYLHSSAHKNKGEAELCPLSGLSKDEFTEPIWGERYHELCYENKAYLTSKELIRLVIKAPVILKLSFRNESGVVFKEQYLYGLSLKAKLT